ncbi:hypothetical protein DN407_29315 (plasmid) [Bacillus sp. JAS24-2]|uniref:DUF6941 family protein n=1 Tax=Bacillus sp. JAS24-2 TaxID=2217832 RepID=UPI0011EE0029|nr:hypothetical protein [Bacillus sp. JAS24-2]QEL82599.1 hypothetical protein DN407_29315 [Bacillus sp. JAS24-2]
MDIKLRYIFLCKNVEVDNSNSISCFDFFDILKVNVVPSKIEESFYLVLGIDGVSEGKEVEFDISFTTPDHKERVIKKGAVKVSKSNISPVVYLFKMKNFPAKDLGTYYFNIYYKENLLSRHPLMIKKEEV